MLGPVLFLFVFSMRACVETSQQELGLEEQGESLPTTDTATRVFKSKKTTEKKATEDSSAGEAVNDSPTSEDDSVGTKALDEFEPIMSGEYVESETRMYIQKIYEVSSRYPYIMKQEIYETSPLDGAYKVFRGERQFVADHILVKFKEGWTEDMVISAMAKVGFLVRRKMNTEQLYLISFPMLKHDSWNEAAETLRSLDSVSSVVPDIYGKALF